MDFLLEIYNDPMGYQGLVWGAALVVLGASFAVSLYASLGCQFLVLDAAFKLGQAISKSVSGWFRFRDKKEVP